MLRGALLTTMTFPSGFSAFVLFVAVLLCAESFYYPPRAIDDARTQNANRALLTDALPTSLHALQRRQNADGRPRIRGRQT